MPYLQNGIFPFLRIFALVLVGIILLGTLVWYRKKYGPKDASKNFAD